MVELQLYWSVKSMDEMMVLRSSKHFKEKRIPQESDFNTLFRFEEQNVLWLVEYILRGGHKTRGGALMPAHWICEPENYASINVQATCDQLYAH